jgi:amphi-Trp domain-containing protein
MGQEPLAHIGIARDAMMAIEPSRRGGGMGRKSKEEHAGRRSKLAEHLRTVADMVECGNVQVADRLVDIADELEYQLELEEEASEGTLEIRVEWSRETESEQGSR